MDPQTLLQMKKKSEREMNSRGREASPSTTTLVKRSISSPSGIKLEIEKYNFNEPDNQTNIMYGKRGEIVAGSLVKIVEKLTSPTKGTTDEYNVNRIFDFLLTYRAFTTPLELLTVLQARFLCGYIEPSSQEGRSALSYSSPSDLNKEKKDPHLMLRPRGGIGSFDSSGDDRKRITRLRVYNVLKHWVTDHVDDFKEEDELTESIRDFAQNTMTKPHFRLEQVGRNLCKMIDENLRNKNNHSFVDVDLRDAPEPKRPPIPANQIPNLNQIHSEELARQLTLIEYDLFSKIKVREYLNQGWNKKHLDPNPSPHITAMIKRFVQISSWVATLILKKDKPEERGQVLVKFIEVANACKELGNYNAVMEIASGLNLASIHRLRQTWSLIPTKYEKIWNQLQELISTDNNYKNLHDSFNHKSPPKIPYLGVYLTMLTFCEEGNQNSINGLINFEKFIGLAEIIKKLREWSQTPYSLHTVKNIQEFLLEPEFWDEDKQYERSIALEKARGDAPTTPKKKLQKEKKKLLKEGLRMSSAHLNFKGKPNSLSKMKQSGSREIIRVKNSKQSKANVQKKTIPKKGTLNELIDLLIEDQTSSNANAEFIETFILTYKTFTEGTIFLNTLMEKYRNPPADKKPQQIRKGVLHVCTKWVLNFIDVLGEERDVLSQFLTFIEELKELFPTAATKLLGTCREKLYSDRRRRVIDMNTSVTEDAPAPILPRNLRTEASLLDFSPLEIARQLCIIEQKFYETVVDPYALPTDLQAPLEEFLKQEDMRINFVLTWIAKQSDSSGSLRAINLFLEVIEHCLELNNFNSAMQIYRALTSYETFFEMASGRALEVIQKLQGKLGSVDDFSVMREKIRNASLPAIPYVGVFADDLKDLQAQKDFLDDKKCVINFEKRGRLAVIVTEILRARKEKYHLYEVTPIADMITKTPHLDKLVIEEKVQSLKMTPKERKKLMKKMKHKGHKSLKRDPARLNPSTTRRNTEPPHHHHHHHRHHDKKNSDNDKKNSDEDKKVYRKSYEEKSKRKKKKNGENTWITGKVQKNSDKKSKVNRFFNSTPLRDLVGLQKDKDAKERELKTHRASIL